MLIVVKESLRASVVRAEGRVVGEVRGQGEGLGLLTTEYCFPRQQWWLQVENGGGRRSQVIRTHHTEERLCGTQRLA